jgi:FHS family Na+ dependent glucose MFS transporter 1
MNLLTDSISPEHADRTYKTIGYFIAFIAVGLMAAALGPTLLDLSKQTRTEWDEIAILFTVHALGYFIGSLLGGRLYDRMPGHRVMVGGLITMAIMMILVPLIPRLPLLAIVWLILGVGSGALDVGGNTLLIWVHGRQVGPYMNGLHFFFGVGAFLAPIIIAQAMGISGDIVLAYWALAILMLPAVPWLLRLPSPKPLSAAENGQAGKAKPLLILLPALLLFLYVGAELAFGGWISTYAVTLGLEDAISAAYLTSAFWGALTVGRLLTIPLAARFRPRWLLLVSFIGCLVSAGVIMLWPSSVEALWLGTLGMGLSMASIFPSTFSLAGRHMAITGQISGYFLAGSSAGGMTVPLLIGQLFEGVGPQVTMYAIMITIILGIGIFAAWMAYLARVGEA